MENKERIIKTLKNFGKLPTSRIAAIVGMNGDRVKDVLDALVKEKRIKKLEETTATYWEVK